MEAGTPLLEGNRGAVWAGGGGLQEGGSSSLLDLEARSLVSRTLGHTRSRNLGNSENSRLQGYDYDRPLSTLN